MAGVDTGVRLPAAAGRRVQVGIRPEDLRPDPQGMSARVTLVEPTGAESYVLVQGAFGEFTVRLPGESTHRPGDRLPLGFDPAKVHVFDADRGARLGGRPGVSRRRDVSPSPYPGFSPRSPSDAARAGTTARA